MDTNICVYTIKKKPISVIEKVKSFANEEICISTITISEMEYGIQKSIFKDSSREALIRFLVPFEIIDFSSSDAYEYGKIRAFLEKKGQIIGPYDLQIASQALSRGLILVTNNVKEFSRVPGLKIENWAGGSN